MGLSYQPQFSLSADGNDITEAIWNNLISISLRDNAGKKSDRLAIAITLPSSASTPPKGAVLNFSLGLNGTLIDKGQFIVDELTLSGPPRRLQIVANAAPMDNTKQSGLLQSHKTRSWDDVTLSNLVATIAKENDLIPKVSTDMATQTIAHIDQINESDMALLTRIAQQYGAVVKPANGYLLFTTDAAGKSASGSSLPVITLAPEQVKTWQCRFNSRRDAQRVIAMYHDVESGDTKEVSIGTGDPAYRILYTYPNKDEAEAAANARAKTVKAGSDALDITMACQSDVMSMVAEGYVQLNGFGDKEDEQKWRVKTIEWTLMSTGMAMHITGDHGTPS
ncbi:contractile injection system protein, VgrG/Pvc8 family [Celerinatantimonas sp. MCCC 1A17872]|uniref:contractile injection system protein, VgrG/Pvc8 family n=1 Tax=Celerinatantimonas sp. MCCC 1A17872 TaxID=3177514 RepID=UPI0038BFD4E1